MKRLFVVFVLLAMVFSACAPIPAGDVSTVPVNTDNKTDGGRTQINVDGNKIVVLESFYSPERKINNWIKSHPTYEILSISFLTVGKDNTGITTIIVYRKDWNNER